MLYSKSDKYQSLLFSLHYTNADRGLYYLTRPVQIGIGYGTVRPDCQSFGTIAY